MVSFPSCHAIYEEKADLIALSGNPNAGKNPLDGPITIETGGTNHRLSRLVTSIIEIKRTR